MNTAKNFGVGADCAVNYSVDSRGTEVLFETVLDAVCCMRVSETLSSDWIKKIDEDYKDRK